MRTLTITLTLTLTARIDRNLAYVILGNGHKGIKVKGDRVKVTG